MFMNPLSLDAAKRRRHLRVVPLLLAVAVNHAYAGTVNGGPGAPGQHGTTPGAAGSAGGGAPDLTLDISAASPNTTSPGYNRVESWAYGGAGGDGGNGAPGGAAGAGGTGANTQVTVAGKADWNNYMSFRVHGAGGQGGSAGTPGIGGASAIGGAGGNSLVASEIGTTLQNSPDLYIVQSAQGGTGGAGRGAAGAANSRVTLNGTQSSKLYAESTATGGTGGAALGSGNGVHGGSATSNVTGVAGASVILHSRATGGTGGAGLGAGNRGGDGGSGTAVVANRGGTAATRATASSYGGAGGAGLLGAAGGRGGSSTVSTVAPVTTSGKLDIGHHAGGGAGGSSDSAAAGTGGDGTIDLTLADTQASSVKAEISAAGGSGGAGTGAAGIGGAGGAGKAQGVVSAKSQLSLQVGAWGGAGGMSQAGRGANGGTAQAASTAIGTGSVTSVANANGGTGGSGTGVGKRGGDGGSATARASGRTLNGPVAATVNVTGGAGGWGLSRADGGNGGSASAINGVLGSDTAGTATLTQLVTAGAGGNSAGGKAGNGGNATSHLTTHQAREAQVNVRLDAYGGAGGEGKNNGVAGDSGSADVLLVLTAGNANGQATGTVNAAAGWIQPNAGDAGVRAGTAQASVTVEAQRRAVAEAGASGGFDRWQSWNGRGGNASAFARAVSPVEAHAKASGQAFSRTEVMNVRAEAIGGTGTTHADAAANGIDINVSAYSSARGAAMNTASAHGIGNGSIKAESISTGVAGTAVTTTASTMPGTNGYQGALTSSNVGGDMPTLANIDSIDSLSYATAAPAGNGLAAVLDGAPQAAAALTGQEMMGTGVMQGSFHVDHSGQTTTSVTAANFQFVTTGERYLTLGLLGGRSYWGGEIGTLELTITNHGTELFTQSFDDLAQAQLFFSDHALGLGMLTAGAQDLLVSAQFSGGAERALYGFQYALALAPVPEPQTWIIMLLGLTVIGARFGRRKS